MAKQGGNNILDAREHHLCLKTCTDSVVIQGSHEVQVKATLPRKIPKNPSENLPGLPTRMKTLRSSRRESTNVYATASHVLEPGQGKNVDISHRPLAKGTYQLEPRGKKDLFHEFFWFWGTSDGDGRDNQHSNCEIRGFSCQNSIGSISRATDSRKRRKNQPRLLRPARFDRSLWPDGWGPWGRSGRGWGSMSPTKRSHPN